METIHRFLPPSLAGKYSDAEVDAIEKEICDAIYKTITESYDEERCQAKNKLMSMGIEPTERLVESYISLDRAVGEGVARNIIVGVPSPVRLKPFGGGVSCNLGEINMDDIVEEDSMINHSFIGADFGYGHSASYSMLSYRDAWSPHRHEKEELSPKERKKRNKENLRKFMNKGKRW